MSTRGDRALEVLDVVMLGVCMAVPLAWVAVVARHLGWASIPISAMPVFCAFLVGRQTARSKWMRDLETKSASLDARIEAVTAEAASLRQRAAENVEEIARIRAAARVLDPALDEALVDAELRARGLDPLEVAKEFAEFVVKRAEETDK